MESPLERLVASGKIYSELTITKGTTHQIGIINLDDALVDGNSRPLLTTTGGGGSSTMAVDYV